MTGPNGSMDFEKSFQFRNNSSAAPSVIPKADIYFSKDQQNANLIKDSLQPTLARPNAKLNRFEELLNQSSEGAHQNKHRSKRHFETVQSLFDIFKDDAVKGNLSNQDVWQYAMLLNQSVYANRRSRLSENSNRDSDQYTNSNLNNDVLLKNAILDLADNVTSGLLSAIVDQRILRALLLAMMQFKVYPEMLRLWENGVNDPAVSHFYLNHTVLALILPLAYDEKRFTYDQIIRLYEVNTEKKNHVFHELLASIGKIAIKEGDNSRGLDCLESLLASYEVKNQRHVVSKSLAELHMCFIGSCKDMKIARHFFDKVVNKELPYRVLLKASHVQSLFENCHEVNEPFDSILDFWKNTVKFYGADMRDLNASYSIINNKFFSIFFKVYPKLTQDSYSKLKEVILLYSAIKPVDEYFLNTIISNYSWNDKVVFQQLTENYVIHNVNCTPVVNRVILKKMGEIQEFDNAEILQSWNKLLAHLDNLGFTYIPIADWAALRDCTILSPFSSERSQLYLTILDAYKNYHQDERAVNRFVKYWLNRAQANQVSRVSLEAGPAFDCDIRVEVPSFKSLQENVDYKKVSQHMFSYERV